MSHTEKQEVLRNAYKALLNFFTPLPLSTEEKSKRILTGLLVYAKFPVLLGYTVLLFFTGRLLPAFVLSLSLFLLVIVILIGRKRRDIKVFYRFGVVVIGLLFLYLLGTSPGYPLRMFWTFLFPLESLYLLGRKEGLLCTIVFYLMAMALVFTQSFGMVPIDYPSRFKMEYLLSLLIVSLMSYCFEVIRFQYQETTKRRQDRLGVANQELHQEIEKRKMMERTTRETLLELKEAQSQLIQSAKLASIGELVSGVAHELNQPLMVIRSNAQLLTRTLKKGLKLSENGFQPLSLIEPNTKRMMNIINHLRTFSRQTKEEFTAVNVNKTIEGCLLMVGEQLRLRNIDLTFELKEDIPEIAGNATQIEQVVLNLITNGRDAIEDLGTGRNRAGVITVVTAVSGKERERVEILVKDTGKGISVKHLDRIFEPFFTTKDVGEGTGLGLSVSYGLIKDHQGEIEVAETGPGGTTFRIWLPILSSERGLKTAVTS